MRIRIPLRYFCQKKDFRTLKDPSSPLESSVVDPEPDPDLWASRIRIRGTDPSPDPDPSIFKQNY